MRLQDLRGAVTGAGSGIGLATAELMIKEGARVAALDLNPPPDGITADVTDQSSMNAAASHVLKEFGGLDVLVCNAGIGASGTVVDNDDDEWHRVYDVNVLGIVRTVRPF